MNIKKRPFKEAREFVHKLKLKNSLEWKKYYQSGKKPDDIPAEPRSYKTEFKGMGDWLGNGNIHPKYWYLEDHYMSFKEAMELVGKKKFKSNKEYREWVRSGKAPKGLPPNPDHEKQWKKDWTNWTDFLGKEFASYEDVKKYVHTLNFKKIDDWHEFTKNNELPSLNGKKIPRQPSITYKKIGTWKNWQDFLGYEKSAKNIPKTVTYKECQKHALDNGISSLQEWNRHYESEKLPKKFPKALEQYFIRRNQWKGSEHFFQKETTHAYSYEKALPIAQKFCREHGITTKDGWRKYAQNNPIPKGLPKDPRSTYEKEVKFRYYIWCGIDKNDPIRRQRKRDSEFASYEEHQKFAEKNNITTGGQWIRFVKKNRETLPLNISSAPQSSFQKQGLWPKNGWYGFLKQEENPWCTYEDVKKYLKPFNLVSKRDYKKFLQQNDLIKINGKQLPNAPESVYGKQGVWVDWFDFLGREDLRMTLENTKKLVKALVDSKIIHQANPEDQVVFAKLLMINEIYGLNNTKSSTFLKQLQSASLSPSGLKKILDYEKSDSLELPDISKDVTVDPDQLSEEKKIVNKNESIPEKDDLLTDYSPQPTKDILKFTDISKLILISIDEKSMKFFVTFLVHKLWNRAFLKEEETVNDVKKEGKTDNDFHNEVVTTFLEEYKGTKELKIPKGYAFPDEPYLMQLYVAYKATSVKSRYFANLSEPGAGKTLSAVLASRVMNAKTTLVLCPKNVVKQWGEKIEDYFPDSEIIPGNKIFSISKSVKSPRYLILNYDKLNQETSGKKIVIFKKLKVDFVIMDEIQFAKAPLKKNIDKKLSRARRLHLENLLKYIKENNPKSRRLGLSATPIINTLKEGRSLLELLSGIDHGHVKTDDRFFFNGVGMYEQLTNVSIRQRNGQNFKITIHPPVIVDAPIAPIFSELEQNPLLMELELTDARIPEIIKKIKGQTIIYTEYVGKGKIDTNIVKKLTVALDDKEITWGLYTGTRKYEISDFSPKNKFQVLICSSPISVGVDGLQLSCNRIIFNSLPWTHARYEQIIGRIARKGQTKPVDVFHINARIPVTKKGRTQYVEYDQGKLILIKRKQTLSDCAVDGILPRDTKIITKTRAMREAIRWYKRLENEDYSFVFVEELDVPEIVEREPTVRKLGKLEEMHKQVFHVHSKKVHEMLKEDPQWVIEYHNEYRKFIQTWDVIPYEYYIKKLNEMSPRLKIGDFGCGEAKIRESLGDDRVKSIDHVAIEYQDIAKTKNIISCDMVDVSEYIKDGALDVAIFSLSMWGNNWKSYFKEANRCLAKNGFLFVCDTTAKMNSWLKELDDTLKKEGFDVYSKVEIEQFTFIEARKI